MRSIVTPTGQIYSTPLFLPVFEYGNSFITIERLKNEFSIRGLITNAYFLYKKREFKTVVLEKGIKQFLEFDGLVVTDSGAFQQFSGPLYLSNSKIIAFQQKIGVDVISPLDIITTPGDNRTTAERKLKATLKRIQKGMSIVNRSILIGVQQGGRFLTLRKQGLEELVAMGIKYIALGSLVPFFTRNHHIEFIFNVIKQAREIVPPEVPIHLYGAGDPLELPFYMALGCDIFDSSSFIHYARDNWYMTPYGALKAPQLTEGAIQYDCSCPYCQNQGQKAVLHDVKLLVSHNLWVILNTLENVKRLIENKTLLGYLENVIEVHQQWFPESRLAYSWNSISSSMDSGY